MRTEKETVFNSFIAILIGLTLLLPAGYIAATQYVIPALNTFSLSMTNSNLLREPKFIGWDNYTRLAQDNQLPPALNYTLQLMGSRMAIAVSLPLVTGVLMGLQGRIGRSINRVILSILIVVISPIGLTALWSIYWGRMWGTQPSPLWPLPDSQMLGSVEGARNSILALDSAITAVIAMVVGGSAYMAVMRGRRAGRWPVEAAAGVTLIGVVMAGGSAALSFTLPYILTGGGPLNSTLTMMLYQYKVSFQNFQMGYAAAISILLILGGIFAGMIIWLVIVVFRLRVQYTPSSKTPTWGNYLPVLSIPALLLIGYPLLSLFLWGNGLVESNGGFGAVLEGTNLTQAVANSTIPITTIWVIQLPITYLAGMALGFLRPFGRVGSNILFLLLLMILFIPVEALHIAWFIQVRQARLLDTPDAVTLPWMISAAALIVFKLFFDGAYERYARAGVGFDVNRFLQSVFLPSLPIVALVGAGLSFMSLQAFTWPLVVTNSPDNFPLTVLIAVRRGTLAADNLSLVGLAITLIRGMGVLFAVVFAALQVLVLDRLAILGGESVSEPESTESGVTGF